MLRKAFVIALLGLFPAIAQAQFEQGDWELTLSGSGGSDKDFDSTSLAVQGSLGYFFTDNIEVALRQAAGYASVDGGDDLFTGSTRVAADFHFDLDRWQPFVGGNIGYVYGDGVNDTFEAAPEAGVKYFVNSTTFIFALIEYQFFFENSDEADDAFDDGQWVYSLGLGFRW